MICESCGLPAAPHKQEDCFKELVRKKRIGDAMFDAAIMVVKHLGEPQDIKDEKIQQAVLQLDLATWRYAV